MAVTSTKPYLIRAIHQWAMENGLTPQILVDAAADGTRVPPAYVRDGRIVLNIHDSAVRMHEFGNDRLYFSARFGGVAQEIEVPMRAVLAVFARENGQGLFFHREDDGSPTPDPDGAPRTDPDAPADKGPRLRLVK